MLLIPAIDLKDGACVRLRQGEMDDSTVYSEDPAAMARRWLAAGARRLHIVDLNGAFEGRPVNEEAIRAITAAAGDVPVQLGGGIRDLDTIEAHLDAGVRYVILGTVAVRDPELVRQACARFPGRVMVGLDARNGKVAVSGWAEETDHDVAELAATFEGYGVKAIVYTDIGRDGMLTGPNVEATGALARSLTIPVIASGGIHSLDDIRALKAVEGDGVSGAITGRAIYEGTLDFAAANEVAEDHAG